MNIPESDLIHTVKVFRRRETSGLDGEVIVSNVDPVTVRGVVVPRSGTVNRDTREFVRNSTTVLCEYHSAIVANRWIECFDAGGGMILAGTIEECIDPNFLHDHLEIQVIDKGEGRNV